MPDDPTSEGAVATQQEPASEADAAAQGQDPNAQPGAAQAEQVQEPASEGGGEAQQESKKEPVDAAELQAQIKNLESENRQIQSAKDVETGTLRRQYQGLLTQLGQAQTKQEKDALLALADSENPDDRDEFVKRVRSQIDRAAIEDEVGTRTQNEAGTALLQDAWASPEFSDLSQEEKTVAYQAAQAKALAAGRNATVTEVIGALVTAIKEKEGAKVSDFKDEIKTMRAELDALKGQKAGDAIEGDEGPGDPAPAGTGGKKPYAERLPGMTPAQIDADTQAWVAEQNK